MPCVNLLPQFFTPQVLAMFSHRWFANALSGRVDYAISLDHPTCQLDRFIAILIGLGIWLRLTNEHSQTKEPILSDNKNIDKAVFAAGDIISHSNPPNIFTSIFNC
jgi:hypothetical protein